MATEKLQLLVNAKDTASGPLKKVTGAITKMVGAYAGLQAAKYLIKDVIGAAVESEKVWNDVAASLKRHNYAVGENYKSIRQYASDLQHLTGISDEVTGQSIQLLLDYNNDLKTSFELVKVASDLSVGGHMDMKAAVDLVGKASVGYTGTLARYGIIIDEAIPKSEKFAAAIEQINLRFGGAAEARMASTAGKIDRLSQSWEDLRENIGKKALPVLQDATDALNLLFETLTAATDSNAMKVVATQTQFLSLAIFDAISNFDIFALQMDLVELKATKLSTTIAHLWKSISFQFDDANMLAAVNDILDDQIADIGDKIDQANIDWIQKRLDYLNTIRELEDTFASDGAAIKIEQQEAELDWDAMFYEQKWEYFNTFMEDVRAANEEALIVKQEALDAEWEYFTQFMDNVRAETDKKVEAEKDAADKIKKYNKQVYDAIGRSVRTTIHQLVRDTDIGSKNTKKIMTSLGQSIRAIFIDVMIDAVYDWIASLLASKAAAVAEIAVVKLQTKAYVDLAAAKAAASAGVLTGVIIKAGAATKAALSGMLLGFDDPVNDALAYKHGMDYANFFIKGAQAGLSSPGFGLNINAAIPINKSSGYEEPIQTGNTIIIFNASGNIGNDYIENELIPAIESAGTDGLARIAVKNENLTGRPNNRVS